MEIQGKIILKLPLQEGMSKAGNPWKKQEYVLETFGSYPRKVKFDFFGERADQNQLEVGDEVTISYDLESREFNGRWYTDVRAFACQRGVAPASAPAVAPVAPQPAATAPAPLQAQSQQPAPAAPAAPAAPVFNDSDEEGDLPF